MKSGLINGFVLKGQGDFGILMVRISLKVLVVMIVESWLVVGVHSMIVRFVKKLFFRLLISKVFNVELMISFSFS